MNAFFNLFLIYLFIFTLFLFKIPNISDRNYTLHKIILFICVFIYQIIIMCLSKIINKCKINLRDVVQKSIQVALFAVIGYSVCIDFKYMCITEPLVKNIPTNRNIRYLYVTLLLIIVMSFLQSVYMMFGFDYYDCEKYDQQSITPNNQVIRQ